MLFSLAINLKGKRRALADIRAFCKTNHDASFPMFSKIEMDGENRHALYEALAGKKSPHAGDVGWDFEKLLVNGDGKIIARFKSGAGPIFANLTEEIEKLIK